MLFFYDDYSVGGMVNAFFDFGKWSFLKLGTNYTKDNHKQQDYLDDDCWGVIKGWDSGYKPARVYWKKDPLPQTSGTL